MKTRDDPGVNEGIVGHMETGNDRMKGNKAILA